MPRSTTQSRHLRVPRMLAISLALSFASLPLAAGAEESPVCGWMPNDRLDTLLPFGAPWRTDSGGQSGSCTFMGTHAEGFLMLSVTQMLHGSASEASKMARETRTNMSASYPIQPLPALGKEGSSYRDTSDPSRVQLQYVGHDGKVVAMGSLTGPTSIADRAQGMREIMQAALKLSDDRKAMKSARVCPFVDDKLAKQLLAGGKYEMQRYGDNLCIAHNGNGAVLTVNLMAGMDIDYTAAYRDAEVCNWASAPKLAGAFLAYQCKEGNARAEIHVGMGADTLTYSLTPGRAPSSAEVELLQELAGKATWVE